MEFSDDGKYLAVCSDQGRVWVYDTADWSETVHTHAGDRIVPLMMWVHCCESVGHMPLS
ncbi:hypothetical protein OG735_39730 [Streptomyces sp. NBC_01210]|uniref:hypothetical protein n=1 Tax=Streptomyces sp. NBC_01210 TaxID=2903774 RepID=UPI002E0F7A73|nr:hypothetical protein OG735_39730 [Streptomyces sp. NBC_01210]